MKYRKREIRKSQARDRIRTNPKGSIMSRKGVSISISFVEEVPH
jgi:hypothetical protein